MENDQQTVPVTFYGPGTCLKLNTMPAMGLIFIKAFRTGLFRSKSTIIAKKAQNLTIQLNQFQVDTEKLNQYNQVCGFMPDDLNMIPISYFQALFVGLLGKLITSDGFPVNPLGLIHIFQSLHQIRPVSAHEVLDLTCKLADITQTQKGIESRFLLEIRVDNKLVWQGTSLFLTKTGKQTKKRRTLKPPVFLKNQEPILVPSGTGRKYAAVSGDYNPHHLFDVFAKLFGFKKAIAHGMWSLARVLAGLDRHLDIKTGDIKVEAFFKRPVFIPASLTLGFEKNQTPGRTGIDYELIDAHTGIPHIKGQLFTSSLEPS